MTRSRHEETPKEQIPTTLWGAAYLMMKNFGPWSLMAIFLVVVWYTGELKSERLEKLVDSNIKTNNSVAEAMKDLVKQINAGHEKVSDMDDEVASINTKLTEIKTIVTNK